MREPRSTGFKSFEFALIDIASQLADNGAFLLPQGSTSFRYSGSRCFERLTSGPGAEFEQRTGPFMECGIGIDTSVYRDQWRGVGPLCEIVTLEFVEWRECRQLRAQADARGQLVLL